MLPSAVQPPVLGWVFTNKLLDSFGVLAGNPQERVFFVRPFVGEDNARNPNLKVEAIAYSSAVSHYYGYIICNGQQAYTFISAGLAAEEINEYSFSAGILVGNKAYGGAA